MYINIGIYQDVSFIYVQFCSITEPQEATEQLLHSLHLEEGEYMLGTTLVFLRIYISIKL